MMHANRWAWNKLLDVIGDRLFTVDNKELQKDIRHNVQKSHIDPTLNIYSTPDDCFDSAYRDIFKAKKAIMAASKARKDKTGKGFSVERLNYKTRKNKTNSIEIRSRSINYHNYQIRFFPKYFGWKNGTITGIKVKEDLSNLEISYSCRLQKINNKYYLNIPTFKKFEPIQSSKICSIDPGVRTMLTGYDPSGKIFEIGTNYDYIERKQKSIFSLQRKIAKSTSKKQKKKLRQQVRNAYRNVENLVKDMHHKVSKWFSDKYKEVLLPEFKTQDMTKKGRQINKTTTKRMLSWAHYKFKKMLEDKMKRRNGQVVSCTEEYTSKTCTKCGRLNHQLGASKWFKCPYDDCDNSVDRDVNAARNIFIKNRHLLTKF